MCPGNFHRVNGPALPLTPDLRDTHANARFVTAAIPEGCDPLALPGDACQCPDAIALRDQVNGTLDLIGPGDANPMGVLGRFRGTADTSRRDDPKFAEQPKHPVGKLVADRSQLDDDARALV